MRWFVLFLLVANIALYFWAQQQSRPADVSMALPPPDVGRLQLRGDAEDESDAPDGVVVYTELPPPSVAVAPEPEAEPTADAAADEAATITTTVPERDQEMPPPAAQVAVGDPDEPERQALSRELPVDDEPGPGESEAAADIQGAVSPEAAEGLAVAEELEPMGEPAQEPAPFCARVGPFETEVADRLVADLPLHLVVTDDAIEEYPHVDGYYALIPAAASRAEGLATLKALRDAGFKDVWLFRTGPLENAISLGLFSKRPSAERHVATVVGKGFKAEISEKTSPRQRRWLGLRDVHGDGLSELGPLPDGVAITPTECPRR